MTKTRAAAAATVLLLSLSGCGGGGGDEEPSAASQQSKDDATASKSIADSILASQKSGSGQVFTVSTKDANCIGDGLVEKLGTEKLQKYKLLDKDLKATGSLATTRMFPPDAKSAADAFFGCTDVEAKAKSAVSKNPQLTAPIKKCVTGLLTEKTLRPFLEKTFQGRGQEAQRDLAGPLSKCATRR
jgi:hypothetical protein